MIPLLQRAREKLTNIPARMGALYEDVEKFFGDIFARYGRFLAKYPLVFVIVSLMSSLLLGTGLVSMQYNNDVEQLYTPLGSPAHKDRDMLGELFPDQTRDSFYPHQLLHLGTYGEIVAKTAGDPDESVLQEHVMLEIRDLYRALLKITLDAEDRGMTYRDLCAERHGECVVDGLFVVEEFLKTDCLNSSGARPFHYTDATGHVIDIREVLGEISMENHCLQANVLRLRFNLKHDSKQQRMLSMHWERKFLTWLGEYEPEYITFTYAASESLDIELADHSGGDAKYFSMTILIMVVYATFVTSGGNWVSTRTLLAHAGIISALLAILASFGLLSMCGLQIVDISGVMPFLLLGIGLDDMFIIMTGWRQTDIRLSIEDRAAMTFRSSAISVTITSLTNILAFCIGATSPFLSVRNFCIFAGVAVFFCYINQLMFFGGCLILHARRVESSRHCVTCRKTQERSALTEAKRDKLEVLCCSGSPPKVKGEDDSLCEKLPHTFLPRFLLQLPMKMFIFVLFVIYLVFSIWGATQLKIGLKLESVVPKTSYLSDYFDWQGRYFSNRGPYVMFVATNTVDYSDLEIQELLDDLLTEARDSGYAHKEFYVSWLTEYLKYIENIQGYHRDKFITYLRKEFLPRHPEFENDILFSEDGERIVASRFYCESTLLNDSTQETNMMLKMREIANDSGVINLTAYSPEFIYYEHYVSILKNTLLAVGVAIIGMLFIALMFIPHPISITCVTISMITIVLGMFGFMHFWSLELSAITNVQIILSVGFCVDFTIHISHAFMAATGKNRNERVVAALQKVGIPVLNAALTSVLGILMLAFANSYAFMSFFKTMLLVILLGLFHSLMVLPVIFSFIGPRRTSRPRVFIPISPNAKNPSETAGPFTGPPRPHGDGDKSFCDAKTGSLELLQVEDGHDRPGEEQRGLLSIREEPSRSSDIFSGVHDHYGAFSPRSQGGQWPEQDVEVEVRLEPSSSTDTLTEYHETSTEPPTPIPMRRNIRDSRV